MSIGLSGNEKYVVPDGYYFTKDHEWLKAESDGSVLVGITDYAAKMLNDIVYVTLPKDGQEFSKRDVFGQVESVKTVSDVYMPVSGMVLKTNQELAKQPEVVASSPYENGWMLLVKPSNYEIESKELLDSKSYREYVHTLEAETH